MIPLSQDSLQDKFEAEGWKTRLEVCNDRERFGERSVTFDQWRTTGTIRTVEFRENMTHIATLHETVNGVDTLHTVLMLFDGNETFVYNGIPLTHRTPRRLID